MPSFLAPKSTQIPLTHFQIKPSPFTTTNPTTFTHHHQQQREPFATKQQKLFLTQPEPTLKMSTIQENKPFDDNKFVTHACRLCNCKVFQVTSNKYEMRERYIHKKDHPCYYCEHTALSHRWTEEEIEFPFHEKDLEARRSLKGKNTPRAHIKTEHNSDVAEGEEFGFSPIEMSVLENAAKRESPTAPGSAPPTLPTEANSIPTEPEFPTGTLNLAKIMEYLALKSQYDSWERKNSDAKLDLVLSGISNLREEVTQVKNKLNGVLDDDFESEARSLPNSLLHDNQSQFWVLPEEQRMTRSPYPGLITSPTLPPNTEPPRANLNPFQPLTRPNNLHILLRHWRQRPRGDPQESFF
ncbi:hypothetical protein L873DRAFT_61259 [Choiromyces venosus 120613-1]|uniref:Uncharacterized protein n=1 Tax=Choiromyces venosus 120613-1 TaxID=1336337 RepID=A0A3N4J5J3_9PEZI|nr:hypothetical protein L873DRAFT_61259 [Choiromyces venosus 120613-1]